MRIEHVRIAAAMFLAIVLSHGVQGNDSVKRCDPFCEDSDSYTPLCTNLIVTDTCHYGNIANTLKWQRDAVKQGLDSYFKGNPVPMARAAFYMAAYARKLERQRLCRRHKCLLCTCMVTKERGKGVRQGSCGVLLLLWIRWCPRISWVCHVERFSIVLFI